MYSYLLPNADYRNMKVVIERMNDYFNLFGAKFTHISSRVKDKFTLEYYKLDYYNKSIVVTFTKSKKYVPNNCELVFREHARIDEIEIHMFCAQCLYMLGSNAVMWYEKNFLTSHGEIKQLSGLFFKKFI